MNKSDITIIIPHLEGELPDKGLELCLNSLKESGFPPENIIVAWNGIQDFSWRSNDAQVRSLFLIDQGQCRAVNAAAATVNTPWIMISNNDMIYPKNWFERLTNNLTDNMLCVSPQLIEPNDGAPTFKKVFCGGLGGDFDAQKLFAYFDDHIGEGIRTGFNLPFLIRKDVWDLVGGYDVNYDPWGSNSDSDLEYKLKLAGVQPMQNTDCPVYHFSQTSGTFESQNQGFWQKNWNYFIEKWGFPRTDEGIWEATFEIPNEGRKYRPFYEGFYSGGPSL